MIPGGEPLIFLTIGVLKGNFIGLALAVIQSTEKTGDIRLTAISAGFEEAVLQVSSIRSGADGNTIESIK
jgi:hypothetical protein